jgi:hypothetical protein
LTLCDVNNSILQRHVKQFVITCVGRVGALTDMFAKRVEQNRQLLYKFPLRDDTRHGGTGHGRVVCDPI